MDQKKLTWSEQTFQAKNLHTRPAEEIGLQKIKIGS